MTTEFRPALHEAAVSADLTDLRSLLKQGASTDDRDNNGWTPLHWAAYLRKVDAVRELLNAGAQVDARCNNGETPLTCAMRHNAHNPCAPLLLDAGADIEATDRWGARPLHQAVQSCRESVALLLDRGADVHATCAWDTSAQFYYAGMITNDVADLILINSGGIPVSQGAIETRPTSVISPLHLAATTNTHEILAELIAAGAKIDAQDSNGLTPLHLSAAAGSIRCTRALLDAGADVGAVDDQGRTARQLTTEKPIADLLNAHEQRLALAARLARSASEVPQVQQVRRRL
jgi:ankyrin repeat protein